MYILISKIKGKIKALYKWHEEGLVTVIGVTLLTFQTTKESIYHWLQFQDLHRIIATNYLLTKLKLKNTQLVHFVR